MKVYFFAVLYTLMFYHLFAQDSSKLNQYIPLTLPAKQKEKNNRIKLVAMANVVTFGGTLAALYSTWYKNYPQSNFHFFNDNKEWLQVDKAGHAWSAYTEGRACIEMWRWAGLPQKQSIWIGSLSGLGYQSIIEVLDGFSSEWGFSWGDYLSNLVGSSLLIGQEFGWHEQRIAFKFSFHYNTYGSTELNERVDAIYGKNLPERILKDYNAQSYWLSANIHSFLKHPFVPEWLNLAVGYGAEGMFGANDNQWTDVNRLPHNRSDIKRYRQIYLAPDINIIKIKTKNKFLKMAFFILNSFKFPTPSLEFSGVKLKWHWLYF